MSDSRCYTACSVLVPVRMMRGESVFLILLLLLPTRGDDSCSSTMWKCGDICLKHEYHCECGGKELNYSEDMWCCYTENCKSEKSKLFFGFLYISRVSCEGAAVSLTEPCQAGTHHRKCPAETGITRKHNSNISCKSTKETTTTNAERQSVIDDNLTIILVVAGALLFVFIAACCTVKMYTSVIKEDFNPVYGDYSDIYHPTEIYNRNPDYSAADIEETGATIIRDNNPHYE